MNHPSCRSNSSKKRRRRRTRRLFFETLENRRVLATFVVNSTADLSDSGEVPGTCDTRLDPTDDPPVPASGICTFRAAIESANANGGRDTITFDLPDGAVISTDGVGSSGDVDILGPAGRIMINGPGKDTASGGILIGGNGNSVIRNLVINNFTEAIRLVSSNNTVANVYIGVDADGTAAIGNTRGIVVEGLNNVVGGTSESDRNVISGNEVGIFVVSRSLTTGSPSNNNRIIGNYIGTDKNGTAAIGNTESGITISQRSQNNVIGGEGAAGNLISGNGRGITIEHGTARHNHVVGNLIGTAIDGETALGNLEGVFINDAQFNCIGGIVPPATGAVPNCSNGPIGTQPFLGNVISGSRGDFPNSIFGMGVWIVNVNATGNLVQGNKIGTDVTGTIAVPNAGDGVNINSSSGNTIGGSPAARRNIISGNTGDGVTIFGNTTLPSASSNIVAGNYIGVDVTGTVDLGNGFRGVHIDSNATNNLIGGDLAADRNIISGNDTDGVIIALQQATGNVVKGNYIGTDKNGTTAIGNTESGIFLFEAPDNIIGQTGGTSFTRNVISGNKDGIKIQGAEATENIIEGNLIGTDVTGSERIKNNGHGIYILDASENRIGTQTTLAPNHPNFPGNVISGNDDDGIRIEGTTSTMNYVGGNLIGTTSNGLEALANVLHGINVVNAPKTRIGFSLPGEPPLSGNTIGRNFDGIRLDGVDVKETLIGGNFIGTAWQATIPVAPNFEAQPVEPQVLLGNTRGINIRHGSENFIGGLVFHGDGQATQIPGNVIAGNFRGVQITEDAAIFNKVQRNSIFDNQGFGIDLSGDGITPNDDKDDDASPNKLQNYPILDRITAFDSMLRGTLNSVPMDEFKLDLYKSPVPHPSGSGEGKIWVGEFTVETDVNGDVEFAIPVTIDPAAAFFTMTATDLAGNTSEFSAPLLQPDLAVDFFLLSASNIRRQGPQYFLDYSVTVRNVGSDRAENALFRIEGNDQSIPGAGGLITLDAGKEFTFTGQWDVTSFLLANPRGAAPLEIKVTADPNGTFDELSEDNNQRETLLSLDVRPRIVSMRTEFQPGYFLAGVSLENMIDVFVDWNGDLDDSQAGFDEQPQLYMELNGVEHAIRVPASLDRFEPVPIVLDLGSDLSQGANVFRVRAETNQHVFLSDFESVQYDQGNSLPWLGTLWEVFGNPAGAKYDKIAEYRIGFFLPQPGVENPTDVAGFYNVPPDRVGFAGGLFGGKIPRGLMRANVRSDRTSAIQGLLTFEAKVGGDDVGGIQGSVFITVTGDFKFTAQGLDLNTLNAGLRLQANVLTPKVPFPPPASFLRGQGKIGVGVDGTLEFIDVNDDLEFKSGVIGFNNFAEGVVSAGVGKVFSVEAGAGGAMRAELQLPPVPCLTRSASILLFLRLKATFLSFEANKTFRFPFDIGGCGAAAGEANAEPERQSVFTDVQPLPRFAATGPLSALGEDATTGLPVVAFPYAKPALARHSDGSMTLVYIDEDATKADGQHLEVFATRYDGTAWSPPVQLTDDTLIDDVPTVAYDGNGNAIAMWSRLKNTIIDPANVDPATLLGELEIVYARWNATTQTWSAPTALTENSEMDFVPRLHTDANGDIMAMWLRETDSTSPIFPDDPTPLGADYMFARWDGVDWSIPAVAVAGVKTNESPQFALGNGEGLLVWSDDVDGDISTSDDREVHWSAWDGTSWSSAAVLAGAGDGLPDVDPQVAYDATGRTNVVWTKGNVPLSSEENDVADQLFFAAFDGASFSTPVVAVETESITEPHLLFDERANPLVVWQGRSEAGPDIFYAVLDRATENWSAPIQFTDDADLEWSLNPFMNSAGELEILHLSRELGSEPVPSDDDSGAEPEPGDPPLMVPTFVSSQLHTESRPLGQDLSVVALTLSEENPDPGSSVQVIASVRNRGDFTTPESTIALSDNGVAVGTNLVVPALKAGEATQIVLAWTVPLSAAAPHWLVARVDPDSLLDEIDESNNEASLVALQPDLIISSVHTALENDTITVMVEVFNQGGSPTSGDFEVALRRDDPQTGAALDARTVSNPVARGQGTTLIFTVDDALATLGSLHIGFIVADSGDLIGELDETNNTNFGALDPQRFVLAPLASGTGPFRVRRDVADVVVTEQNAAELLREQLAALQRLTLPATSQNDQFTIDFTGGNPVPARGIFFAGADGDDTLLLEGGGTSNVTFHGGSGQNSLRLLSGGIHLNLTAPDESQLSNLQMIDIEGNGDNSITLTLESVRDVSPASNELMLLADIGDTVAIGDSWTLTGTEIASGHFFRILEQQGATLKISGPSNWNNPVDDLDVNNDGSRSPVDALIIINDLNSVLSPFRDASNKAIDPVILNGDGNPENDFDNFYRDTNRDGFFSPLDVLIIFNYLNSPFANAEGEKLFVIPTDSNTSQQAVDKAISTIGKPAVGGGIHLPDNAWRIAATRTPSTTVAAEHFAVAVDELALSDELYDLFRGDLP